MSRYEVWSDTLASPEVVALTDSPTLARLEYAGEDLAEARHKAEAAKQRPEVVAATIRRVQPGGWRCGVDEFLEEE